MAGQREAQRGESGGCGESRCLLHWQQAWVDVVVLAALQEFDISLRWFIRGTDWALRETSGKGTYPTNDDEVQSMQCRNHLDALTCLLSVQ